MIRNRLSELLGKKRIKMAELSRGTGISYSAIKNIYHDKTIAIEFDILNRLCSFLECTPNDILEFTPDE